MKEEKQLQNGESRSSGPGYWRSLDELADKPEFKQWLHREFPEGASEIEGVNRRGFLKIMSASFAMAGLGAAGCRRPEQYILPYAKQPEGTIPGLPMYFSSAVQGTKEFIPVVVETHQHRPTHIEGNAGYALTKGSVTAQISASVLDLYDPDRMTHSYEGTRTLNRSEVKDVLAGITATFGQTRGQGLAVLARPCPSESRRRMKAAFREAYPSAIWAEYDPKDAGYVEAATEQIFGRRLRPDYDLRKARRILSVDADFLGQEPGSLSLARGFAEGRRVKDKADAEGMNRLYAVESGFSLSGTMADHRLRLESGNAVAFLALVAARILQERGIDLDFANVLKQRAGDLKIPDGWIEGCVADLMDPANSGKSVVMAGSHLPVEAQLLSILINDLLGASESVLRYRELPDDPAQSLTALAERIRSGAVESLVIMGGNPVYDAPADLEFVRLLKQVKQVVRYGYSYDETGLESDINIAASHALESWGDGDGYDGTYFAVQPMIEPLFDTFSELEMLALLNGSAVADPYGFVRESFAQRTGNADPAAFQKLLSVGLAEGSAFETSNPAVRLGRVKTAVSTADLSAKSYSGESLEIRIQPDTSIGDGSFCNNGWLQECPDPMTKLTWDNAILISPKLAEEKGFDTKEGTFLIGGVAKKSANFKRGREESKLGQLTIDGVTLEGPVHILPGLADYTVVVNLGYGRSKVGRVGEGCGFNVYPVVQSTSPGMRAGAQLTITSKGYRLANTQEHWSMEGRAILREANVKTHMEDPQWVSGVGMESHSPPVYGVDKDMPLAQKALTTPRGGSAYETPDFGLPPSNYDVWKDPEARAKFIPEQQWGMSIDLNTCLGCQSCIVACQSENNIPIVGKDQIMRGREMHWIRLDRYYSSGDLSSNMHSLPSDPQASVMPVGCLHCEMAPCEQVCPVNATVHDRQGLNVMAYNRCVGTRYCANNCPYKVRRFNFFDYNKRSRDAFYAGPLGKNLYKTEGGILHSMQRNPDVTVRMRGVMEKCTYCVQRIEQGKIAQRVKAKDSNDIHVPDGIIQTACQTACPTDAITFGDISDPESAVSKMKANDRDYALLGYLNTRPRTTYLGRLRNPNPNMPDYEKIQKALSRKEYKSKQPVGAGHGEDHADADDGRGSH